MQNTKPKLVDLTEVTKTNDETNPMKESPVLVNVEGIVSVNSTGITPSQIIIGQTTETKVSFIQLITGRGVYVKETLPEIKAMVEAIYAATIAV